MGSLRWVFFAGLLALLALGFSILKNETEAPDTSHPVKQSEIQMKDQDAKAVQVAKPRSGYLAAKSFHHPGRETKIPQAQANQAIFKSKPQSGEFEKAQLYAKSKTFAELKTGECYAMAYMYPKRIPGQNMNAVPVACKFAQVQL